MGLQRLRRVRVALLILLCTAWPVGTQHGAAAPAPAMLLVNQAEQPGVEGPESEQNSSRNALIALIVSAVVATDVLVLFWIWRRRAGERS